MTTNNYIFVAVLIILMFGFHNFIKYRLKKYRKLEKIFLVDGIDVNATIISMRQVGVFFNNNPVVEMTLKIEDKSKKKSWLIEKHNEIIMLITLDAWQVGHIYQAKTDEKKQKISFVRDDNDRPLLTSQK
ncbi:hypothetical protein Q5705_20860 [Kosakonia sp. H02]|nr:hypothetical protein Q5705_20860 [Kosakonia sp. H02]